ncbi:MAG: hypothetical protein M0Z69_15090 [Actinomycetota bacterium]|nr:hypothetical protein [Actinomycetota bacterium]
MTLLRWLVVAGVLLVVAAGTTPVVGIALSVIAGVILGREWKGSER